MNLHLRLTAITGLPIACSAIAAVALLLCCCASCWLLLPAVAEPSGLLLRHDQRRAVNRTCWH